MTKSKHIPFSQYYAMAYGAIGTRNFALLDLVSGNLDDQIEEVLIQPLIDMLCSENEDDTTLAMSIIDTKCLEKSNTL